MARRHKQSAKGLLSSSLLSSPMVKYGLYAVVGYFGYRWWTNRMPAYTAIPATTPATPPVGTVIPTA